MTEDAFEQINKKLDAIEATLNLWKEFLEEAKAKGEKKVKLPPVQYGYEPDVEEEIEEETQEEIDDVKKEVEDINDRIGYGVESGRLDINEADEMTIEQKKEWLKKNDKEIDPY